MLKYLGLIGASLLAAEVVSANGAVLLGTGCASTAIFAATSQVERDFPTFGRWYIQEFRTLVPANEFEIIFQRSELDANGAAPCVKAEMAGRMGATDCKLLSVRLTALSPTHDRLCRP